MSKAKRRATQRLAVAIIMATHFVALSVANAGDAANTIHEGNDLFLRRFTATATR